MIRIISIFLKMKQVSLLQESKDFLAYAFSFYNFISRLSAISNSFSGAKRESLY